MLTINCSHQCRYQIDGKCTLNTDSCVSQCIDENSSVDCPYFETSHTKKQLPSKSSQ